MTSAFDPSEGTPPAPLIVEAMKKAAVAWLSGLPGQPTGRSAPVWCSWLADALYVVSGPGEQPVPGLSGARHCQVSGRGDNGALIVTWPATVTRVEPGSEEWDRVVPLLSGKRLNLPADDDTGQRWARDCTLSRLAPDGEPAPALPDDSRAAVAPGSPAARRTDTPFHLHRTRRRRKR